MGLRVLIFLIIQFWFSFYIFWSIQNEGHVLEFKKIIYHLRSNLRSTQRDKKYAQLYFIDSKLVNDQ